MAAYDPALVPSVLTNSLVNCRGLGADRLVHLGVRGELRRSQRRHLVGSRGNHPGGGGRRRRIAGGHCRTDALQAPAAGVNASGCVVTNDMCSS